MSDREVTIYHSPDADDAFMFYGMVQGAVQVPGYSFRHELKDIESLNKLALRGELEVTAVSVHAFAFLKNRYAILRCGASMGGKDYGPRLIARTPIDLKDGKVRTIALPGELTSAALATKLYLREQGIEAELVYRHFEEIQPAVKSGELECGVIIHEGQITHQREGLTTVLDLGKWWWDDTSLPLPLGINIVTKELGAEGMRAVQTALHQSIEYSLAHRSDALDYALSYGRGLSREDADRFVAMYVNERTRDIGREGIDAINLFISRGRAAGLIPAEVEVEFVS